jgi:hypothetical protein
MQRLAACSVSRHAASCSMPHWSDQFTGGTHKGIVFHKKLWIAIDGAVRNMDSGLAMEHSAHLRNLHECQQCGWKWISRKAQPPRRCNNPDCRSMRWNRTKRTIMPPPPPPSPPSGDGLNASMGGAVEYLPDGSTRDLSRYSVNSRKPAKSVPDSVTPQPGGASVAA